MVIFSDLQLTFLNLKDINDLFRILFIPK